MNTNSFNPQEDLQTIRNIMERSSRFLSLSGLSGIFAGICALVGAAVAWFAIIGSDSIDYVDTSISVSWFYLGLDAVLVFFIALVGAVYFSQRRAKKAGQAFWTVPTRKLLLHLMIPLVAGGFFSMILLFRENAGLIASAMLIFYGLSLVNAGKFTLGEIHYLGLTEIILGILAGFLTHYGLLFWSIGFGAMHIIYGAVMYYRHER